MEILIQLPATLLQLLDVAIFVNTSFNVQAVDNW